MAYPPNVDRWLTLVQEYVPAAYVDEFMWIMSHESGGDPTVQNPDSTATGLMQILAGPWASRPSADLLKDPEYNIKYAAQQLGAAAGNFAAWGQGPTRGYDAPYGQYPGPGWYTGPVSGASAATANASANASATAPQPTIVPQLPTPTPSLPPTEIPVPPPPPAPALIGKAGPIGQPVAIASLPPSAGNILNIANPDPAQGVFQIQQSVYGGTVPTPGAGYWSYWAWSNGSWQQWAPGEYIAPGTQIGLLAPGANIPGGPRAR